MKKKLLLPVILLCMAMMLPSCGSEEEQMPQVVVPEVIETETESKDTTETEIEPVEVVEEEEVEETREGMVRSELTNEWIDEALADQRPIAVLVDNEKIALDHYGINSADIIYEVMNSTENDRVTRLFAIVKDYDKITQFGSIRSARVTNFLLAWEYNAIVIHDGGPAQYINPYIASPYTNNLSGGFARFSNGKASEFTEYVTWEDYSNPNTGKSFDGLEKRIEKAGYSRNYTTYYPGEHWNFSKKEVNLGEVSGSVNCTTADLSAAFKHNKSKLVYNESTQEYEYYEYEKAHIDALTGETTSFKNVILQPCDYEPCREGDMMDQNGYIQFNLIGSGEGYYITNGKAVPITWMKGSESSVTRYYLKSTGEEISLNTGKTYVAIIPSNYWDGVTVE